MTIDRRSLYRRYLEIMRKLAGRHDWSVLHEKAHDMGLPEANRRILRIIRRKMTLNWPDDLIIEEVVRIFIPESEGGE